MSTFMGSARETQIAAVRVRRGCFGKLVLQVRYKIERPESPLPGRELIYHVCGLSRWRDANANDFAESLMVANLIGMSDEGKPS
ncbi:hypothetical protein CDC24_07715 [Pseudomonas aeruginosa]|nr:hypothetical protein CDC23_17890 [Pseudomonas aeruginosa]OWI63617.1 hypothetical protein CDC24_07715 [Pseudomonas aeruginosa]